MKELKKLRQKNPNILRREQTFQDTRVKHFMFTVVNDADRISLPACGDIGDVLARLRVTDVTCQDCLAALDDYAKVDSHAEALALAAKRLPKILNPDPEIMKEKHGTDPSIQALNHIEARNFLRSKSAASPDDLPNRLVGGLPETFFKNMYEVGLIDQDGEPTGLTAAQVAAGEKPVYVGKITVD